MEQLQNNIAPTTISNQSSFSIGIIITIVLLLIIIYAIYTILTNIYIVRNYILPKDESYNTGIGSTG